jgi:hypothetical protein
MGAKKRGRERSVGSGIISATAHILCAVIVIFLFLAMTQCSIKKPEAPSWQTPLVIPLAHKTWDMPELIEKLNQDNLGVDSFGNPVFVYEGVLDTININSSFVIPDVSQTTAESLGIITLDPPNPTQVGVNLSDYVSLVSGAVPPIAFDINENLPSLTEYSSATVYHGSEIITIDNDFGLTLDTVIVTLSDIGQGVVLETYQIPGGLEPAEVSVHTVDLSGRTISNQFRLNIHCYTRGALSFSLGGRTLDASVGMPDGLEVSAATAQIPELSRTFSQTIPFESDHEIHFAQLEEGRMILDIRNNSPLTVDLTITFPEFLIGGISLVANQTVPGNEIRQLTIDLTGYTLAPIDWVVPQSFVVNIAAGFNPTAPELMAVTADDNIAVTAAIHDIVLGEIDGVLASVQTEFADIQQNITIPKGCEGVTFQRGTLVITIDNGINLPGSFSASIIGNNGQSRTLAGIVTAGTAEDRVTSSVVDTEAAAFLDPLPDHITVSGTANFAGGQASTTIHPSDYLVASILLYSPLEVTIDSTVIDGGWENSNLNLDTAVVQNLAAARFHAILTNRLPVGVSVEVLLGPDSATLYTAPQVRLGPIVMNPGTIGPDGQAIEAIVSQVVLNIDSTQLQVLENDTLWIGELITLLGAGDTPIHLTANDSLSISSWLEVDVNVNDNLWED